MPWLLNRVSISTAILAASLLLHLGFFGAIVLAERRVLPPSILQTIDVNLVRPDEIETKKVEIDKVESPEPPKSAQRKRPEPVQSPPSASQPRFGASTDTESTDAPPPELKRAVRPETPDMPQGGPAGEGKSKLTPEEIASLRAQIQKCWRLPVGIPGMIGLEVVLRVSFGPKGQLAGAPVLLQAPASERGPMLVEIAMNALQGCYPYKLPPGKYADWKTLDLKFTATGLAGLAPPPPKLPKRG